MCEYIEPGDIETQNQEFLIQISSESIEDETTYEKLISDDTKIKNKEQDNTKPVIDDALDLPTDLLLEEIEKLKDLIGEKDQIDGLEEKHLLDYGSRRDAEGDYDYIEHILDKEQVTNFSSGLKHIKHAAKTSLYDLKYQTLEFDDIETYKNFLCLDNHTRYLHHNEEKINHLVVYGDIFAAITKLEKTLDNLTYRVSTVEAMVDDIRDEQKHTDDRLETFENILRTVREKYLNEKIEIEHKR